MSKTDLVLLISSLLSCPVSVGLCVLSLPVARSWPCPGPSLPLPSMWPSHLPCVCPGRVQALPPWLRHPSQVKGQWCPFPVLGNSVAPSALRINPNGAHWHSVASPCRKVLTPVKAKFRDSCLIYLYRLSYFQA